MFAGYPSSSEESLVKLDMLIQDPLQAELVLDDAGSERSHPRGRGAIVEKSENSFSQGAWVVAWGDITVPTIANYLHAAGPIGGHNRYAGQRSLH